MGFFHAEICALFFIYERGVGVVGGCWFPELLRMGGVVVDLIVFE